MLIFSYILCSYSGQYPKTQKLQRCRTRPVYMHCALRMWWCVCAAHAYTVKTQKGIYFKPNTSQPVFLFIVTYFCLSSSATRSYSPLLCPISADNNETCPKYWINNNAAGTFNLKLYKWHSWIPLVYLDNNWIYAVWAAQDFDRHTSQVKSTLTVGLFWYAGAQRRWTHQAFFFSGILAAIIETIRNLVMAFRFSSDRQFSGIRDGFLVQ